jgi:hypothetical protein
MDHVGKQVEELYESYLFNEGYYFTISVSLSG